MRWSVDCEGMATVVPALNYRRGLAFLAGVGFAAVPTVGPYLAILAVASGRLQIHRADRWWWAAAVLLGLPWLVQGTVWPGLGATAQVLAVWLIFRSASELRSAYRDSSLPGDAAAGLLVGFAAAMGLGLQQAATWRPETARGAFDLFAWSTSPALFGHAMLVLAALLAVILPTAPQRLAALALGAIAVLASGTQEAVLVWILLTIGFRLIGHRVTRRTAIAEWALIALMVLVATGATSAIGLGRTGYRLELQPAPSGVNLFRGTAIADGEWWYPLGVGLQSTPVVLNGVERVGYAVTKMDAAPWSRLQQIVVLEPGTEYVLSVAWRADDAAHPGLDGWGRASELGRDASVAATFVDGAWRAESSRHFELLGSGVVNEDDGWRRGHVAFRYVDAAPLTWYVGAVPDRRLRTGSTVTFAEFQLMPGDMRQPYVPNAAGVPLVDLRTTRLPLWREAVEAITARPWWGWGVHGFSSAVTQLRPDDARFRPVAAHAHNLLLDTWVERGLVGVVGLLLLAGVLSLRALQHRDRAMFLVLLAIALLNVFETTMFNGALIYPLAAVLGWRAVGHMTVSHTQTGYGSAAAVRLALAATDVAVAALALLLGLLVGHGGSFADGLPAAWTPGLAYVTLLWPAFAWASGLYPGYGRMLHDELGRSVRASAAAAVTLGFAALLLPEMLPLGTRGVLVAAAVAVVLAPFARAGTKQVLEWARLWGRPVVMLGTGPIAAGVVRYLIAHPGVGLRPVAAFGEAEWDVRQLPVRGGLEESWAYLARYEVRHAIVTPDAATVVGYDEVLRRAERALRFVQFVPDLHGIPASSVVSAPLGTTLGLEVRNQLASGTNRAVKRTVDVLGAAALLVPLAPILLAIALWIRLDSRGRVFYLSPRLGRHGRTFACIKFRTMHDDADDRLAQVLATDAVMRAEYERFHKLADDPRVTRAGRVLRRLSLDELPQLLNVLAGEMSLVGPRPYMVRELDEMGPERDIVLLARPGLTGYWQVSGRNDFTFAERQSMEAHYVRNWSVWWDVELLFRTPRALVRRTGS